MAGEKGFNARALTSWVVILSFLTLTVTGTVLYVSPQGRVANPTGWNVLGLEKEEWSAIHMTLALLFVVASAFHIYFNWGVIMHYIKTASGKGFRRKREFGLGLVLTAVVVAGTILDVPPLGTVIALNDRIKDYWESRAVLGPYPHFEEDTLAVFAMRTGTDVAGLMSSLEQGGFQVAAETATVNDVAALNNTTPSALWAAIRASMPQAQSLPAAGSGAGLGRKTLEAVCEENGLDLNDVLGVLRQNGVDADGKDTLKDIANKAGMRPTEVLELIAGGQE